MIDRVVEYSHRSRWSMIILLEIGFFRIILGFLGFLAFQERGPGQWHFARSSSVCRPSLPGLCVPMEISGGHVIACMRAWHMCAVSE